MSKQLTAPVNLFYDAYAVRHDTTAAREVFVDGATIHWQSQAMDAQAYEQVGQMFLTGFPDLTYRIDEQLVADDTVVTRGTWSGTNTGSLMGMPATGKSFRAIGVVIDRVVENKIVERWEVGDVLGLMQQIGLAPTS
jgi:predicted ester cyclase